MHGSADVCGSTLDDKRGIETKEGNMIERLFAIETENGARASIPELINIIFEKCFFLHEKMF